MARKSRKNLPQPEQVATSVLLPELEEAKMPAAIYGRLSVEDEEKEESMETQIALVQDYINRSSELSYVDTYFDNGFTGTNFKRPAFTRLMNDVRQKKIKCIVVKDLSRFGRNYLEAGYYIETVFPFLGVRLIAVTDNFDSTRKEDMESLALPIRNMVNAMYAKDISKKIWTSLQRKKEAGYAVGNDAPYGYIRNPVTKRNEIDPEAAFYVQLIFQWELMGVPIFEIARRMTLLQVPTPREWHRKMVEGKEVLTYKKWGVTTIRHILENQTYVGDTINNKSTQKLFAGQDKHDLPKEQWYVAKNTHPAIIARDDFEKVQKILNKNRAVFQTVRAKSEQIRAEYQNDLAGMVFCADCGRPMEFERLPHGAEESKKVCYYICKARQADDKCIGHQIPEKLLKALIMDQLHLFIVQLSDKRKVLEELQKIEDVQNLVEHNIMGRNGKNIPNITIGRMIRNKGYTGYLINGNVEKECPELRIIEPEVFEKAQELRDARRREKGEDADSYSPHALLCGKVFCAHCGNRLNITSSGRTRLRADGTVVKEKRYRYSCNFNVRHPGQCDGQSGYGVTTLDAVVESIVCMKFEEILECSKSNLLEEMRRKDLDAAKKEATRWKEEVQTKVDEQDALKKEMIRVIQGTSGLDREMIQQMVNENKEALLIAQTNLADSEKKLKEIEEQNQKAERNCSDLFTWASTYKGASFERRQAILKQFIKEVRVGRDYNIEIVLNVPLDEFEEFKRHAASAGRGKNQKNKSQNPQKVGRCTSNAGIVVLDKTAGETISIVPKNAAHAILRC